MLGCEAESEEEMKDLKVTDFVHAFLSLTTLAAAIVLFRESDKLWLMVVILLTIGWTSLGLVSVRWR